MFVLILPEDYTLADSQPMPQSAKIFDKRRLAVYWKPREKYGAQATVIWKIREFAGDLREERDRINAAIDESENVPSNAGVAVDTPALADDSGKAPPSDSVMAAIMRWVWNRPTWLKASIVLIFFLAVVIFAVWMSLPDDIKSTLIKSLFSS